MSEQKKTCGDFGGRTKSGEPCGQIAHGGLCWMHREGGDERDNTLTDKQRRFVEEYCIDFNGSAAARRAGYADNGAGVEAHRLLRNAKIMSAVSKRLDKHGMSAAEATSRMADMARADFRNFTTVGEDGRVRVDLASPEAQAMLHTVRKIRQTERVVDDVTLELSTEIELHDAKDALHKILQAHGAYIDRVDVTTDGERVGVGPVFILPDNGRSR